MRVYAVVDDALSPDVPLGDSLEVFVRREDAERFIEDVRGDHFASEIAAVTDDGGDTLLRERVAALDDDQRQLLRDALDEVAVN